MYIKTNSALFVEIDHAMSATKEIALSYIHIG